MPRPRYEAVASALREQIQSGKLPAGSRIPTEREIIETYSVSITVARAAIAQLRNEGLVVSHQGKGTFVQRPRQRVRRVPGERYRWEKARVLQTKEERLRTGAVEQDTGLDFKDLDFHAEYRTDTASKELAEAFDVPVGTLLLHRIYRTRFRFEDSPLSLIHSYLVYDLVKANPDLLTADNEPWPGGTNHQLFTVGIELDRIVDDITARPPTREEAEILGLDPGISVIMLMKTSIDTKDRVVEVSHVVLPGDRAVLSYTTELPRWPS
jgi:GntR family transcriptional regulator